MMLRLCFLLLLGVSFAADVAASIATNHHVILITIDGGTAFYFDDPKAPLPNLRKLAAGGVGPNHTTLVTGVTPARHSVLFNGLLVRNERDGFKVIGDKTQAELVAVPTVYDFLHGTGFSTANVNWPCTPGSTTLDFNFPDLGNQLRYTTPRLIEELTAEKILDDSSEAAFADKTNPKRDKIWADTACYLMRTHRPNLMLLHFLVADSRQHVFGPHSPEGYEVLGVVDNIDVAPTVAHLLGERFPNADGKVLKQILAKP